MNAAELLRGLRVVPVVVVDDADKAVTLARTLLDAGLQAIEVTLRTPAALDAIAKIAANVPDMIVGAGSVRHAAQGRRGEADDGRCDTIEALSGCDHHPADPGCASLARWPHERKGVLD